MTEIKDIRKSAFVTYRHCNKKFEFNYDDPNYWGYGNDGTNKDVRIQRGLDFHEACDNFFEQYRGLKLTYDFPKKFRNPFSVDQEILYKYFEWFMIEESKRYLDLFEEDKAGYWMPLACELEVKHKKEGCPIGKTGHIDRIDILPDDTIQIVEYKAGKSYDMDNKYAITDMNQEIGFYATILNDTDAFNGKKIKTWKVINPFHQRIWVNKISPVTLRAVDQTFNTMVDKILNKGTYDRNEGVLCNYCPYVTECLYGDDLIDFGEKL